MADWTPHFNTHNYEGDWSGVALRTSHNARVALYPDPTATVFENTDSMLRCNYVPQVLDAFQCGMRAVRFLRLGAGAAIREHRDYDLSFEDGTARIHIPVKTSSEVQFALDGHRVEMSEGEAWYLNFNLPHSVKNSGDEPRIHLVIDCVVNDWLGRFFEKL